MKPTLEQEAVLDFMSTSTANGMLIARAGTGKSTMLKMIDEERSQSHTAIYLVFNRDNADKEKKEQAEGTAWKSSTAIKTINSLCYGVWAGTCPKRITMDKNKVSNIFKQKIEDWTKGEVQEAWEVYDVVKSGVDMARNIGYIPEHHPYHGKSLATADELYASMDEAPGPLAKELIDIILTECIRQSYQGLLYFEDQCYMAALFGANWPQFPLVLVDEYQDLNAVQHLALTKLCRNSRQIGVGDDAQSIYAFRGAVAGGMEKAIKHFSMTELGLTTSFRCPSEIVNNVHWRVPDLKASRVGGSVSDLEPGHQVKDNSTVICRNNKPLLQLAMMMLWNGRSVNVSGVDIGDKLLRQMTKLGSEDMSHTKVLGAIDAWEDKKLQAGSTMAKDMAGCMRVFCQRGTTLGAILAIMKHCFEQRGTVNFVTGHKSKGLEWDRVYHLDSKLCTDRDQDPNIHYVIDTRSKDELIYM